MQIAEPIASPAVWQFAANAVVLLHLGFIVFVLFGAVLVMRYRWVAWVHIPAFVWGAGVEFLGAICPLTPLEQHLRLLAGDQAYTGGFVEHYILPVMYPAGLTQSVQNWLGLFVVAINIGIYAVVLRRIRQSV
jgi:Protein of Unknown function (DUF2784)